MTTSVPERPTGDVLVVTFEEGETLGVGGFTSAVAGVQALLFMLQAASQQDQLSAVVERRWPAEQVVKILGMYRLAPFNLRSDADAMRVVWATQNSPLELAVELGMGVGVWLGVAISCVEVKRRRAEAAKLKAEEGKIRAETKKIRAETKRIREETERDRLERTSQAFEVDREQLIEAVIKANRAYAVFDDPELKQAISSRAVLATDTLDRIASVEVLRAPESSQGSESE